MRKKKDSSSSSSDDDDDESNSEDEEACLQRSASSSSRSRGGAEEEEEGTQLQALGAGAGAWGDGDRRRQQQQRGGSVEGRPRHSAGAPLESDDDDEVLITDGTAASLRRAGAGSGGWRGWGAARKGELGLWVFFVLVGGLILLAGTFLVLHNATRASRHPDLGHNPHGRLFVHRTEPFVLPAGQYTEVVFANVSRPEPGQALAIHQVRLQLVDIAGKLLPLEQVYRSYMVLSADNGTRPDANNNNNNTADRTLVALGPEGSKESVRLPRGYYILSHQEESWSLRCQFFSSWGQLTGVNLTVAVLVNITYSPLATAIREDMKEVRYQALGLLDVTDGSKPNGCDLAQDNDEGVPAQWSYDVVWSPSSMEQVILAYGFTQIGALSSELLEVGTVQGSAEETERQLLQLEVTYEKSGLIAAMDRQYPTSLVLAPNSTLRVRSSFINRPFGRVVFYWQLYLHALRL